MANIRLTAPFSFKKASSDAFYGEGSRIYIQPGAKGIQVGFYDSATDAQVAGAVLVRVGENSTLAPLGIPAENLYPLFAPGCAELPLIEIDAKALTGTPDFVIIGI